MSTGRSGVGIERGQVGPGHNIDERMPQSLSTNLGRTWTYSASPFPPIGGGQRLVESPVLPARGRLNH